VKESAVWPGLVNRERKFPENREMLQPTCHRHMGLGSGGLSLGALVGVFEVLRRMQNALATRRGRGRACDRWGAEKVIGDDLYSVPYVSVGNDSVSDNDSVRMSPALASVEWSFLDSGADDEWAAEASNTCCSRNSVLLLLVSEYPSLRTCYPDSFQNRLRHRK
jgi:hypothetical protein